MPNTQFAGRYVRVKNQDVKKALLLILILSGFPFKAFSCECIIRDLEKMQKESLRYSEFIFLGEVISSSNDGRYKLRVIETFKGDKDIKEIEGGLLTSCSFAPDKGEGQWIVYGDIENGKIEISQCGLTRSYSNPHMVMTSTYPPPPFSSDEETYKEYIEGLKIKAQADWMAEIQMLREQKE